jgi:hypothetical protein
MAKAAVPAAVSIAGSIAGGVASGMSSGKGGRGGGGPGSGMVQTQSETKLPDWVENAARQNLAAAYGVSGSLLGPWEGRRVANLTPGAVADIQGLQSMVGSSQPALNLAQATTGDLQGFNPLMINPGSIATTDLSPYMNPYIDNVIKTGLQGIDTQRRQALNQAGAKANLAKAFGGSRHGVIEGVTNAGASTAAGNLASQLAATGYDRATQLAGQDISTNLAAQSANQNADLAGAGVRLNAANAGGNLAALGSQTMLQQIMAALQGQTLLQQQNQAQIDADRAAYAEQQQFPLQQLQIPMTALSMTPYGSTTTGTQSTMMNAPSGNGLMSGLGTGLGILGSLGSLFGSNGAFPMFGANSIFK